MTIFYLTIIKKFVECIRGLSIFTMYGHIYYSFQSLTNYIYRIEYQTSAYDFMVENKVSGRMFETAVHYLSSHWIVSFGKTVAHPKIYDIRLN